MRQKRSHPGILLGIAAALLWVTGAGAARAQSYAQGRSPAAEVRAIETELASLQPQLAAAEADLKEMQSAANAGRAPRSELRAKEEEVQNRRGQMERLQRQLVRSRLYQRLERPVDVKLREATVAEAARALSQAIVRPIA